MNIPQKSMWYRRAVLALCLFTVALVLVLGGKRANLGRYLSLSNVYLLNYRSYLSASELSRAENFTLGQWLRIRSVASQFAGQNTAFAKQLFKERFPVLTLPRLDLKTPSGRVLDYAQLRDSIASASEKDQAPNVVHYVLPSHRRELKFHELLSLLASFHLVRASRIFLWHHEPLGGGYWDYLVANVSRPRWESTVVMAYRPAPESVYKVPVTWRQHRSDLIGLEAVLLFGGLRLQPDVIPLRAPAERLRRYEAVIGLQHERGVGSAAYLAKPGARFLLAWHLSYQLLDDTLHEQHSTLLPFALHAAFPLLAELDPRAMHRPGWQSAELRQLYGPRRDAGVWDWRTNWLVNLWRSHYDGPEVDFESARQLDSSFGEIARFILFGSASMMASTTSVDPSTTVATSVAAPVSVNNRSFVYAQMDDAFVSSQFEILRDSIRGYSGKYSSRVNQLMVHRLPVVNTSEWQLQSPGGRKFSVAEVQLMTRDPSYVVPNVAQYVLPFENPQLQFHHLVCLLSGVWVMRPSHVIIWYGKEPFGTHWDAFRKNLTDAGIWESKIILIKRPVPTRVYTVPVHVKEHQADVMRMEAVLVFGGAYFDIDVVTLKPLEPLRQYPFTIGRETGSGLCNGVFLSAPNSTLLSMWYVTYQTLDDNSWVGHSVSYPNWLCSKYPTHCHVEEDSMDRPNWTGGEITWIYGLERKWDWKKKNYVMHLWYRFHGKQYTMETIKYVDSMLGDMFRFVLYGDSKVVVKKSYNATQANAT